MSDTFLEDVLVLELGDRVSAGLCGGLLDRLGADVWLVACSGTDASPDSKWAHREVLGAGKRAVRLDLQSAAGRGELCALIERADVVITSSDWQPALDARLAAALEAACLVCDVSAFGSTGPLAGVRYTDTMMQAFAGLMDSTGTPDGAPIPSRIPITECCAAVFATAGVLAALRSRRASACAHRVEVAMFDSAVSMLSTFLPTHFTGGSPRRMGNRHPSMAPWNAYAARDGWLLLCSASDDMWGRVCDVVGRPELKSDARFRKMGGRVAHAEEADAALEPWIARHSVAECLEAFNAASVPCGPVSTIAEVLADASLHARDTFHRVGDRTMLVPGPLIHGAPARGRAPQHRERVVAAADLPPRRPRNAPEEDAGRSRDVLAGVRVVEMGSYTTAPLAARNLGAFGADVVKAEPPAGELSRASPPYRDGQSYFCTLSNSDKRSVAVDLRSAQGKTLFAALLSRADVFVENMKPGVLERFGFGAAALARINPRLVYCSVSGYGASSPLADRPAMDTTIQGSAGLMDLTRGGGVPFKTGISISDLLGGQFALAAILAGLEYRSRTGRGQFIDLSMQELSAWLTQFFWNAPVATNAAGRVLACSDGYVYAAGNDGALRDRFAHLTRAEAVAALSELGIASTPVNTVSEVATHSQTAARGLIVQRPSNTGTLWPLLASPIRLSPFPGNVRRAFGGVGEDLDSVAKDWALELDPDAGRAAGAAQRK
jgi:crotonobetainyl-CoA:carnitine CoA-transferase CaiB-like acyl-CoA transferase